MSEKADQEVARKPSATEVIANLDAGEWIARSILLALVEKGVVSLEEVFQASSKIRKEQR